MATKKRTQAEQDRMTDANIQRVIKLLDPKQEGTKPITKKEACQILGMSYNTTRLGTVIEEYEARKKHLAQKRGEKRGTPATSEEINYAITSYLQGSTIDSICERLYRSAVFVKNILEKYAVPLRNNKYSYFNPQLVPEDSVKERFQVGEKVYSMRYDSLAKIDLEQYNPTHGWIYRIKLLSENNNHFAYQPAYELASLEHLKEIGISV